MSVSLIPPPDDFAPLTGSEKTRLKALLSAVTTRTLLQTLARLYGENEDAGLIVAILLDRLPPEESMGWTEGVVA